ncbi:MAG TPA: Uma2 family endonuclease [Pirellula sp.]|nr:Uma2 family endonuclease [Pirellula sp.]
MSSVPRYIPYYTLDNYRQWGAHWELIDGAAIAMTPSPFGPHVRIISRLARMIGNQLERWQGACEVYTNLGWIVRDDTVLRPDLMVVCGEQPQKHLERQL